MPIRFRSRPRPDDLPLDPRMRRDIGVPPLNVPHQAHLLALGLGLRR